MCRMLTPKKFAKVQHLLAQKTHSKRKIAALLGVSRTTVGTIALGKGRVPLSPTCDDAPGQSPGPPARCPGCGALVHMPCLLCRLRERRKREPRRKPASTAYVSGDLDLRPEHRQRYEEVRRQRIARERTTGPIPDPVN